RTHWLKCKMHWFTTPESARLYQAEVEIKKRVGESRVQRWWDEDDKKTHLYRIEHTAADLHFELQKEAKTAPIKFNHEDMSEWDKTLNTLTEDDMKNLRDTGNYRKPELREFYLPGSKDHDHDQPRQIVDRSYDRTKSGDVGELA